nr:elongation factor P hydroxylase [Planctomycetota bacterium]
VFDRCFAGVGDPLDRARMVRGGDEPLYLPAGRFRPIAEVVYARGLAQSCLHEAAHWLTAGPTRRELVDYGFWYIPDGRDAAAQELFEHHEATIQALESLLSEAAGVDFTISCDNLVRPVPSPQFAAAIARETARLASAMPSRAQRFSAALGQRRMLEPPPRGPR